MQALGVIDQRLSIVMDMPLPPPPTSSHHPLRYHGSSHFRKKGVSVNFVPDPVYCLKIIKETREHILKGRDEHPTSPAFL